MTYNIHLNKVLCLNIAIVLLGLLFSNKSQAQGELALLDLKMRTPETVDVLKGQNDGYVFCFLNARELQLTVVKDDFSNSFATFPLSKILARSEYIISTRDNAHHTAYFFNKKFNSIQAFKVDLSSGTTQAVECAAIPKDESFLTAVVINNKFYMLTVSKIKSTINLWSTFKGDSLEKKSFETSQNNLHLLLEDGANALNENNYSSIGVSKIDYSLDNDLTSSRALNKLYVIDEKIILTMDGPDQTWMGIIDAMERTFHAKTFSFKLEKGEGSRDKQGNSFLYNQHLFRTTINNEMMNVSILSTDSVKLNWSYNIFPEEQITIKNGPFLTEGEKNKVLAKTSEYFNRVQTESICIAVNEFNGQYVLQVGSYDFKSNMNAAPTNYPRFSIGMGMGGISMGGVGMGVGMNFPIGGSGMGNGYYLADDISTIQLTYFYSLMDAKTFEHSPLVPPKSISERISDFKEQKFTKNTPDLIKVTSFNDKIVMGYFVKNNHKYQLVEIR